MDDPKITNKPTPVPVMPPTATPSAKPAATPAPAAAATPVAPGIAGDRNGATGNLTSASQVVVTPVAAIAAGLDQHTAQPANVPPKAVAGPEPGQGVTGAQQQALNELDARQAAYTTAKQQADALDRQLATTLARVSPGMTPDERQAFITNFHNDPAHATVYKRADDARTDLANSLQAHQDVLAKLYLQPNNLDMHDTTGKIANAYALLADSPQADVAQHFTEQVFAHAAGTPTGADAAKMNDLVQKVVGPVAQHLAVDKEAGARNGSGMVAGQAYLDALAAQGAKVPDLQSLAGAYHDANDLLDKAAESGDDKTIEKMISIGQKLPGPLSAAFKAVGLAMLPGKLGSKLEATAYTDAVKELSSSTADGIEATKTLSKLITRTAEEGGEEAAGFAEKLVPALNIAAGVLGTVDAVMNGDALAAAGNILTGAAGVAALVPGLQPLAGVLGAVGFGISLVADWGPKDDRLGGDAQKQLADQLVAAGLDLQLARNLAGSSPATLKHYQTDWGLDASQIQTLGTLGGPEFYEPSYGTRQQALESLFSTIKSDGTKTAIDGPAALTMLAYLHDKGVTSYTDQVSALQTMQQAVNDIALRNPTATKGQSPDWWAQQVKSYMASSPTVLYGTRDDLNHYLQLMVTDLSGGRVPV